MSRSDSIKLTRASLIGVEFRISKVYGATPIGLRVYIAYSLAVGCRESILRHSLDKATANGLTGFQNVRGEACSWQYYKRIGLTSRERERRECEGRAARAIELYEQNERRRA